MDHDDLMARVNEGTSTPAVLIRDFDEPGQQQKDWVRMQGAKKIELLMPVKSIIRVFEWISKKWRKKR